MDTIIFYAAVENFLGHSIMDKIHTHEAAETAL